MTLTSIAVKKLEKFINHGRWALTERLPSERDLCCELSISRGTLRSALHALVGKGILEMKQGSGAYVKALPAISYQQFEMNNALVECLDALLLILPNLCKYATQHITPSQCLRLENLLSCIGLALHALNSLKFAQAQQDFLYEFISCLDNSRIQNTIRTLFPEAKILAKYLERQKVQQWEEIFALLAQSLNACRKMQEDIVEKSIQAYIISLREYCDSSKKK